MKSITCGLTRSTVFQLFLVSELAMIGSRIPAVAILFVIGAITISSAEGRMWTMANGGRTVDGDFVRTQGDKVLVRSPKGKVITLALKQLSAEDQAFVAGRQKGKADATDREHPRSEGRVLVKADFSTDHFDPTQFGGTSWNVPDTWEIRDGAIACIYDPKQHPGKAHGKSIDPKFKAHNVRVSYRVKFEGESARLSMLINAPFPAKTGVPVWHLGDVNARLPRKPSEDCVSISERDFTYDENDPRNTRKSFGPAEIFKPFKAYEVPGVNSKANAPLVQGQWYQFVVEAVGTQWTLWIDGKQVLTQTLKHSDCEKASVNFIAMAPLLLDDIAIEELPR